MSINTLIVSLSFNQVTPARAEHCFLASPGRQAQLLGEEQLSAEKVIDHDILPA